MTYVNRVFNHSCESMPEIPDGSVHTCVTSPPYFNLRDYGITGQIGLEDTPQAYVERMVGVFREVRRVLRDDGTAWINIGDSYAANRTYQVTQSVHGYSVGNTRGSKVPEGLKQKDLIGIPWRLAFALQADGWFLRCDVIWSKPNPMPESVEDRPTRAHEYIFLLSKSPRYYYDADAIREPLAESSIERINQPTFDSQTGGPKDYGPDSNRSMRKTLENFKAKTTGRNSRMYVDRDSAACHNTEAEIERKAARREDAMEYMRGANKRSVWTVATVPYPGAHFATFPRELITPCILAGAPANGVVLDPFMGSGTTAEVALGNGRNFVGYELNPQYCTLIRERLGLFGEGVA